MRVLELVRRGNVQRINRSIPFDPYKLFTAFFLPVRPKCAHTLVEILWHFVILPEPQLGIRQGPTQVMQLQEELCSVNTTQLTPNKAAAIISLVYTEQCAIDKRLTHATSWMLTLTTVYNYHSIHRKVKCNAKVTHPPMYPPAIPRAFDSTRQKSLLSKNAGTELWLILSLIHSSKRQHEGVLFCWLTPHMPKQPGEG